MSLNSHIHDIGLTMNTHALSCLLLLFIFVTIMGCSPDRDGEYKIKLDTWVAQIDRQRAQGVSKLTGDTDLLNWLGDHAHENLGLIVEQIKREDMVALVLTRNKILLIKYNMESFSGGDIAAYAISWRSKLSCKKSETK